MANYQFQLPTNIKTEIPVTIRTPNGDSATETIKIVQLFNDFLVDSIREISEKINSAKNKYKSLHHQNLITNLMKNFNTSNLTVFSLSYILFNK